MVRIVLFVLLAWSGCGLLVALAFGRVAAASQRAGAPTPAEVASARTVPPVRLEETGRGPGADTPAVTVVDLPAARATRRRRARPAVAIGIVVATVGAGSAAAALGSLPDPLQRSAAEVAERVGIDLPRPASPAPAPAAEPEEPARQPDDPSATARPAPAAPPSEPAERQQVEADPVTQPQDRGPAMREDRSADEPGARADAPGQQRADDAVPRGRGIGEAPDERPANDGERPGAAGRQEKGRAEGTSAEERRRSDGPPGGGREGARPEGGPRGHGSSEE